MAITFRVEGLADLEDRLKRLEKPVRRQVARKAMRRALKPVADTANAFWPTATDNAFRVTPRVKRTQPRKNDTRNTLHMFVGSGNPLAHLIEFGTVPRVQKTTGRRTGAMPALPMLQPAWDIHKQDMLRILRRELKREIWKAFAKQGRAR